MSDGQEHNRLELEQPFNMTLECWRFSIEAYFKKDKDGAEVLIIKPTKIIIQEVLINRALYVSCFSYLGILIMAYNVS